MDYGIPGEQIEGIHVEVLVDGSIMPPRAVGNRTPKEMEINLGCRVSP